MTALAGSLNARRARRCRHALRCRRSNRSRYGWESRSLNSGRKFEEIESDLASKWDTAKGSSRLIWTDAKGAVQAAWLRVSNTVERLTPGDSDHDGK